MTIDFWNANNLSATFAGISATASVITAVIAGRSLHSARQDSHDRTRPVVVPSLKPGPSYTRTIYFTVRNDGQSLARDVRLTFDPGIEFSSEEGAHRPSDYALIGRRYSKSVPVLAAGVQLSNVYSYISAEGVNPAGAPEVLKVKVEYLDDQGRGYADVFDLDLDLASRETFQTPSDSKRDQSLRIAKAVEAVARASWER